MRNDIIQLFENCGIDTPEEYLIEGASAKAPQYKVNSPEEFEMLVSQDPTYDSSIDDGKFIDWIFSLWRNYKTDKKNEEKYNRALAYKQEHPDAQIPPKPERLSQDKVEDFEKIRDYLEILNKNLKDLKGNMGQFKSIAELASFVNKIRDRNITVDEKAKENFKIFREAMADGLEVVYNGPNFIIGVPTTYEASSHFKSPVTEWCTAYPEKYEEYMNDYGGNYYIHLNKHTGELYQAHYESDQFKDSDDREINKEKFISEYSELKTFYDKIWNMNNAEWWMLHNKQPTEKQQFAGVKENGLAIKYIDNPSEEVQLAAVKQNGFVIQYIENPSEEVQLAAAQRNGRAIQYIEKPSEEVQLAAIKDKPLAINYIIHPSINAILKANSMIPSYSYMYLDMINHIKDIFNDYNENEQEEIIKTLNSVDLIKSIKNPSEKLLIAFVKLDPFNIWRLKEKGLSNEKLQIASLTSNKNKGMEKEDIDFLMDKFINPSEKVKQLARQNGWRG